MPARDNPSRPELLLPAGSFDAGLAAIEGGADALYFGFADFSARKAARNLDALEYRRLLRFARDRGLALYAAINTVILETELPALAELLAFLGAFPPDAVIIQDWGLARLIKARHPGIAIHASTQTAIQGPAAARIALELGASRLVLPRETSLEAMGRLHAELPELELEAFAHGALCYSFSGLCLASGRLLGRSGNRGECAQVCRSYYEAEPRPGFAGGRGYWFSCRDLDLSKRVGELAAAGIRSLKVEGRMKSPEYCHAVARLYRGAIDGLDTAELETRREAAATAFAREGTEGWLFERGGARLIDASFPGHRGSRAGTFRGGGGGKATLELASSLGLRDGLLAFDAQGRPLQFAVADLRDKRTGRPLSSARPGDLVELACPGSPPAGSEARRISDRRQDRRAASPEEYPPALLELPLELRFAEGRLSGTIGIPCLDGSIATRIEAGIEPGPELPAQAARNPGGFLKALSVFAEGGEAEFRLLPKSGSETLPDIFVPPSILKREKNRFYARSGELLAEARSAYARESPRAALGAARGAPRPKVGSPPRAALVFPREELPSGLPFATPRVLREGCALPSREGRLWLPLAPLVIDDAAYAGLVRERVRDELAGGSKLVLGLGALHHLALARELVELEEAAEDSLAFFLDIHLYIANKLALAAFDELLPRIAFAYSYLEAPSGTAFEADPRLPPLVPVGEGFEPPLFLSLGCLRKQHGSSGSSPGPASAASCPPGCDRSWACRLADRDRRYLALVEDCVSMLYRLRVY
ncbi:MAG TPA: peptidase U32 family protein [Spirochaetales bacterium]|nr:peptidase U32 family protein [Spirochaetales bacterium]HRY56428.1 peptidase U32 family protein [Spirochaetia bacterium]HRZ64994.1 peptidase U32 family protein [Spirochaetia bacterium]